VTTFLVAHGAWSAGWAWKKMHSRLAVGDDRLFTPTYTGLGERVHLAGPSIDLETHVQDMLAVLEHEDLRDVVLIGHSYGGMVVTGVADQAAARVASLVYLDAFVPGNGQALVDLGRPDRFWHIMPGIGRFNWPISMLTWDVIVLNGYLLLNLHICGYLVYCAYRRREPSRIFYIPFVFVAIAWAISIHTVTAFLYSGLGGRPFWNSAVSCAQVVR